MMTLLGWLAGVTVARYISAIDHWGALALLVYVGASVVIACVTLGFSLAGMLAGMQLGDKFGKRMEVLGGLILIGIGLNILITHLIK
jgi:putative Mn2+ efflux pump MntP